MSAARFITEGTSKFLLGMSAGTYVALTGGLETCVNILSSVSSSLLDGTIRLVQEAARRDKQQQTGGGNQPQTIVVHGGGADGVRGTGESFYAWTGLVLAGAYIGTTFIRDFSIAEAIGGVSKRTFNNGLSALGGVVEGLGSRLLGIGKQLNQVKGQIDEVETKVDDVGERVDEVKAMADVNSEKLDGVDSKVTYVQRGVHLLCSVVAEGLGGRGGRLGDDVRGMRLEYDGEDEVDHSVDIEEVRSKPNYRRMKTPDRGGGGIEGDSKGKGKDRTERSMDDRLSSLRKIAQGLDQLLGTEGAAA